MVGVGHVTIPALRKKHLLWSTVVDVARHSASIEANETLLVDVVPLAPGREGDLTVMQREADFE